MTKHPPPREAPEIAVPAGAEAANLEVVEATDLADVAYRELSTERELDPKEASFRYLKLSEDLSQLTQAVGTLSQQLGENDATIIVLRGRVTELKSK